MPRRVGPGARYVGRPAGIVPVNVSLDRDAVEVLNRLAPTIKAKGHFLSRVLLEYTAVQAERARWLAKVQALLEEER